MNYRTSGYAFLVASLIALLMIGGGQEALARTPIDGNPCGLIPFIVGLPPCDTPCVCKKLLPPPSCGIAEQCPEIPWNTGSLIYCSTGGCCVNVNFRYRNCISWCEISIDWLEYLYPGTECTSCQMVPDHFTSVKTLMSTIERWLLVQPYGGLACFKDYPRLVRVRKPGCMMEGTMPFDSCGNLLVPDWSRVTTSVSCYGYVNPTLRRVIAPCNVSCCVTQWQVSKNSSGNILLTLQPGSPTFTGVECSPRINPPPPGVDPSVWLQNNPPQYDPEIPCKNTCECKIPINTTPPYQYNPACFPSMSNP